MCSGRSGELLGWLKGHPQGRSRAFLEKTHAKRVSSYESFVLCCCLLSQGLAVSSPQTQISGQVLGGRGTGEAALGGMLGVERSVCCPSSRRRKALLPPTTYVCTTLPSSTILARSPLFLTSHDPAGAWNIVRSQ